MPRDQWPQLLVSAFLNVTVWMAVMSYALLWLPASEAVVIAWTALLAWPMLGDLIKLEVEYLTATPAEQMAIEAATTADGDKKATELAQAALGKRKTDRRRFGISSKNKTRVDAMLARAAPHLQRSPNSFNADPMLVATKTHTLRFVRELDLENPIQMASAPLRGSM